MKITRFLLLALLSISLVLEDSRGAALTTIEIDTGNRHLENWDGAILSGGNPAVDGDGTVVQVGYYQGAFPGHNFGDGGEASFIPLIGAGSVFGVGRYLGPPVNLTVGDFKDNGTGNGEIFADSLNLFLGTNGGANDSLLPTPGTPLAVRIFSGTTLNNSAALESVSNNLWLWLAPTSAPSQPLLNLNFDDSGLVAISGQNVSVPGSNIRVPSYLVPEPSGLLLLCSAGVLFFARRSRS